MGVWLVVLLWKCQSRLLWRVLPVSCVVSAVGATLLYLAEFWCLWWHPLLVLEWFVFVSSGALMHCVALWVALGACVSTVCCVVALSVVRQALVMAVSESFPLALGSECVRHSLCGRVVVVTTGKSLCDLVVPLRLLFSLTGVAGGSEWLSGCRGVPGGTRSGHGVGGGRVNVGNAMPRLVAFWGLEAKSLGRFPPFSLSLLSPFPLFAEVERYPPSSFSGVERGGAGGGSAHRDIREGVTPVRRDLIAVRLAAAIRVVSRPSSLSRQGSCRDEPAHRDAVLVAVALLVVIPSRRPSRSRQHLVSLGCFRGRGWRVGVCSRAGVPLGPSGGNAAGWLAAFSDRR
ncbi:hypothetical protein Taro_043488 [Colocasia esculenta]|uniref:Uncharacterized protein n=1 Tax=Colocasia esculenta TaxID=4460 RepID=A0A843WJK0_COLES|nr:hypothetical protein [Colocasia esculenta]